MPVTKPDKTIAIGTAAGGTNTSGSTNLTVLPAPPAPPTLPGSTGTASILPTVTPGKKDTLIIIACVVVIIGLVVYWMKTRKK